MTYARFAYLYDDLMKDVPYQDWVHFLDVQMTRYGVSGMKILDLACGTGELSVRLAAEGYEVTGVDLSLDMLAVAQEKAAEKGLPLFLIEQDMSQLEGLEQYDVVGIFCDSLNYLQTEEEVLSTFAGVWSHTKKGGLFLFDVHSLFKMNELFTDQTYAYNGDKISYIWQCFAGNHPYSVEHELTFFELEPANGLYRRYDELHFQRTFPIAQYEEWLRMTGFEILAVTADFQDQDPNETSERIFFTARKK
jgi:ubiquinone/menaquinone biosynthesis C-methylase UbiE